MEHSITVAAARRCVRNLGLILGICASLLACAPSESPNMKRGKEWMEIKRYAEARQEFMQVISQEPKNTDARHEIARSFMLEKNYASAIEWADETLSVNKEHSKAREVIQGVIAEMHNMLRSGAPNVSSDGLSLLKLLLKRGHITWGSNVNESVAPLLRSNSPQVSRDAFGLLREAGTEVAALTQLTEASDVNSRTKAFELMRDNFSEKYVSPLRRLLNDNSDQLRLATARLLIQKIQDSEAKKVLASAYRAELQREIALGKSDPTGLEFHDRIREIALAAPSLDDPSIAGELAELVFIGRVYGFLARDIQRAVNAIGGPGRPYIAKKLERESEYRALLRAKGSRPDQIDWRFSYFGR